MSNEDTYVAELKKIVDGFNRELPRVPGVINGAASAAKRIMFWDQDYVERKRQEAQLKFGELQQEANNFITACEEECGMVVTAKSLRGAADAFEAIDFTKLLADLDVSTMMGDRGDWVSTNQQLVGRLAMESLGQRVTGKLLRGEKGGTDEPRTTH